MNYFRTIFLFLLVIVSCHVVHAQTDYSLRMWSLSTHLAGVIDDPLTDVYLNPARLAVFDKVEVLGAKNPGRTLASDFAVTTISYDHLPHENYIISFTYDPLIFGVFFPLGQNSVLSIGTQSDISGSDKTVRDTDYDVPRIFDEQIEGYTDADENTSDKRHLLFDMAVARKGKTSFGIRLRASHDMYSVGYLSINSTLRTDMETQTELYLREWVQFSAPKLEINDFNLTAGIFRPGKLVTDVVVGTGVSRQLITSSRFQYDLTDEDVDNNGQSVGGGMPYRTYVASQYHSNRDYLAYQVFGKAHLSLGKSLRSTHTVSYKWSSGNGNAAFTSTNEEYDRRFNGYDEVAYRNVGYSYDGTTCETNISTSIGYTNEVHERVLIAVGIMGIISLERFEEDGSGRASIYRFDSNDPQDTLSIASPYIQKHDTENGTYTLVLPAVCEWNVCKYVTLRAGMQFIAFHKDDQSEYYRDIPGLKMPSEFEELYTNLDCLLDYDTEVSFTNGIEVNVNEKFILELFAGLDLFSGIHSYMDLASYSYLSFRYRF